MKDEISGFRPGVLGQEQIEELIRQKTIENASDPGYSSLDLHLGSQCWRMKGGIKGLKDRAYSDVLIANTYAEPLDRLEVKKVILLPGSTYVFQLREELHVPKESGIFAFATGRSSIGRLDILTRLIADHSDTYDEVPQDYSGRLYLEVTPITFPIQVSSGVALSHMRFFRGEPKLSQLKREEFPYYPHLLFNEKGEPIKIADDYYHLTLDLTPEDIGGEQTSAFVAREDVGEKAIDLTTKSESIRPGDYWERITAKEKEVLIEPERFYIFRSKERFKLPNHVAVFGQAVSETLGELRIHYAGFVHPGFGSKRKDGRGTPLIFEVRVHNVRTFLRDSEALAKILFYKMSQPCNKIKKGDYEDQELALSKYFASW